MSKTRSETLIRDVIDASARRRRRQRSE